MTSLVTVRSCGTAVKNGAPPKNARLITSPVTAERIVAESASSENSFRTISKPKNTPVIGALNVAEIAPAAPHATIIRSRPSLIRTSCPSVEASAEPICTIGPSRPTDPPPPMHSADASALTTVTGGRIRPPFSATASITSGTP